MLVRGEIRLRWRSTVGLVIVIAIAGGVVCSAVAGARRTDSAYPRFLREQNAGQGGIASDRDHVFGFANVDFDKIVALPEVVDTARFVFLISYIRTPSGLELTPIGDRNPTVSFASTDDRYDRVLNRMRPLEGRLPDPTRVDEAAVSYEVARRYHVKVGDVLQMHLPTFADFDQSFFDAKPTGPTVALHVTGIEVAPGELGQGSGYPPIHLTSAFYKRFAGETPGFPAIAIKLHSDAELSSFVEHAQTSAIVDPEASSRIELLSYVDSAKAIKRTAHIQAIALELLALLTAISAVLILVQTIARQTFLESSDFETLGALGLTRGALFQIAMIRTVAAAVAGAIGAMVIAFAVSGLAPIGVVRLAEPSPGLAFDGLAVGIGGVVTAAVVIVIGIGPAIRASRYARAQRREGAARSSRLAETLASAGFSPSSIAGVRMALEKGRGRSAVPVRSTIIGTIVGVAAVATALTFGASIDHAVHTPYLQGVNWDGVIGDDFDPDDAAVVVPILQNDPSIEEFSAGGAGIVAISGQNVTAIGMQQVRGHIEPVILEGRAPYREDEVVLGVRTMREVHAAVGDTITVSTGPRSVRMRVVGKAVSPTIADEVFSGRGTFMTLEGLKTLVPNNSTDIYLFRVRDRAQLPQLTARLRAALPALAVGIGPKGGDVQELSRVRNLPLVLAGLLALLAIATLAHLIVTAVRTRGPQLAILKTLGFVRRQIRAVVAWQATTLAFVALVVAVPLGYIVGRLSWGVLADQMGFVSAPVIPAWELLSVVPGLVLAANLVAVLPARRAARTRPAVALRSE